MYGHDLSRTNYNPDETILNKANVKHLGSLWQADIGYGTQPTSSTPSVANGKVYVGSSVLTGSNFLSFDARTGSRDWEITLGHSPASCFGVGIGSTSAISDHVVVVGGADGAYYGIDADAGKLLWRDAIGGGPSSYPWASPLVWSGRAYIGVSSGCGNPSVQGGMQAVDLKTGSVLQSQTFVPEGMVGADIWNSPALTRDGSTLVAATGNDFGGYDGAYTRAMVTLDPLSMVIRSAYKEGAPDKDQDVGTTPVIFHDSSNRTLVAANHKDESFYVYDLAHMSAGPIWQRHTGLIEGMMPAYDPTFGRGGTLFYIDGLGTIHAADPATGTDRWQPAHLGSLHGNIAIANGLIFANLGPTGLAILDEATGKTLTTLVPDHAGKTYSGVAVSGGVVYWLSGSYLNAWSLPAS
jgi:polyvinyl alcohol dehydrogenase (cytochrome)